MSVFTERLKEAMNQARMNQSELASKIGSSKGSISGYVNGTTLPSLKKIEQIAEALGVQADFLINPNAPMYNGLPKRITPEMAARCMGVGRDYVKNGLKNKTLDLGSAVLFPSGRWRFEIQPYKLKAHVGEDRFNEFFKVTA